MKILNIIYIFKKNIIFYYIYNKLNYKFYQTIIIYIL